MAETETIISEITERIDCAKYADSDYAEVPVDLLKDAVATLKEQLHTIRWMRGKTRGR